MKKESYSTGKTLPHDFSLKESLLFESSRCFQWCKAISPETEARGLQRFLSQQIDLPHGQ